MPGNEHLAHILCSCENIEEEKEKKELFSAHSLSYSYIIGIVYTSSRTYTVHTHISVDFCFLFCYYYFPRSPDFITFEHDNVKQIYMYEKAASLLFCIHLFRGKKNSMRVWNCKWYLVLVFGFECSKCHNNNVSFSPWIASKNYFRFEEPIYNFRSHTNGLAATGWTIKCENLKINHNIHAHIHCDWIVVLRNASNFHMHFRLFVNTIFRLFDVFVRVLSAKYVSFRLIVWRYAIRNIHVHAHCISTYVEYSYSSTAPAALNSMYILCSPHIVVAVFIFHLRMAPKPCDEWAKVKQWNCKKKKKANTSTCLRWFIFVSQWKGAFSPRHNVFNVLFILQLFCTV